MERSNDSSKSAPRQEAWDYMEHGNALSEQAAEEQGEQADRLFEQSYDKYTAAHELEPGDPDILYNWGIALADHARTKEGDEAEQLFNRAYEKWKATVDIEPSDYEVWHNWGVALLDHSETRSGAEAGRLLAEAEKKLAEAYALGSDFSAYVLASVCALQGREEECREWLTKAYETGELEDVVDRETMEGDADFESVRDRDWFREIVKSLG